MNNKFGIPRRLYMRQSSKNIEEKHSHCTYAKYIIVNILNIHYIDLARVSLCINLFLELWMLLYECSEIFPITLTIKF